MPGTYTIVVQDTDGNYQNFGRIATVEDVDGNGIVDTLTDCNQNVIQLNPENAFGVPGQD